MKVCIWASVQLWIEEVLRIGLFVRVGLCEELCAHALLVCAGRGGSHQVALLPEDVRRHHGPVSPGPTPAPARSPDSVLPHRAPVVHSGLCKAWWQLLSFHSSFSVSPPQLPTHPALFFSRHVIFGVQFSVCLMLGQFKSRRRSQCSRLAVGGWWVPPLVLSARHFVVSSRRKVHRMTFKYGVVVAKQVLTHYGMYCSGFKFLNCTL